MDRRTQIKQWLKAVIEKNLSGTSYRAFIFGSQANLTYLRRSDIDIGIISDQPIQTQQMAGIYKELEELPMLYKVDLVNFNEVDNHFKSVALKNIELL